MDKILDRGFYVKNMAWRKHGGEKIVEIRNLDSLNMPDKMISYPLNLLGEITLEELLTLPNVSVEWEHRVVGLTQDEGSVSIRADHQGSQRTFVADFVVGCDGARSGVRKALLGRDFSGYTLGTQMVTTNVREPRPAGHGFSHYLPRWCTGLLRPRQVRLVRSSMDDRSRALVHLDENLEGWVVARGLW